MTFWVIFGLCGQAFFFGRFLMQWVVSEKAGASIIPPGFWFLSLGGGALLLIYAIHIKDPVFILGQSTGLFIYTRNLMLIFKRMPKKPVQGPLNGKE